MKSIFAILKKDHKKNFQNLDLFYEALRKLRFEGKHNVRENLREIRGLVAYFKRGLNGHMKEEERTLFPFLQSYIPRLEPMVWLLLSENQDFRNNLKELRLSLLEFNKAGRNKTELIHKIGEQGTYLVCLLRSHMQIETQILYRVADKELRPSEKKRLIDQFKNNAA